MEKTGLFRCTPPTHVVLAFAQALAELEAEGGVAARGAALPRPTTSGWSAACGGWDSASSCRRSCKARSSRPSSHRSIRNFDFRNFYDRLHDRGHVIYFGKVTSADCFRIGNIGRIFESDIDDLLGAIGRTLQEWRSC